MPSIHGHEVLQMMISSGESYTVATLEAAIIDRFGKEVRFHTCSAIKSERGGAGGVFAEKRQIYCR